MDAETNGNGGGCDNCPKCGRIMDWDFAGNVWCEHCGYGLQNDEGSDEDLYSELD